MKLSTRHKIWIGTLLLIIIAAFALFSLSKSETEANGAARLEINADSRILVWVAPALKPMEQLADAVGTIEFVNGDGNLSLVMPVVEQSGRVEGCTGSPVSPDRKNYAIYMGTEGGVVASLFLLDADNQPRLMDDSFHLLACNGSNGLLKFSPDSSRIAYIDYERGFGEDFADGTLRVLNTADFSELFSETRVVGMDQNDDGVAFVQFFTDNFNEADEAIVYWWDGSNADEITAFEAEENCKYLNASPLVGRDQDLWISLVHRCKGDPNQAVLYRINRDDGTVELIQTSEFSAAFAPFSETNRLFLSPDGKILYITFPDGVTNNTVGLNAMNISDGSVTTVIDRLMIVPTFSGTLQPVMKFSPDRDKLALTLTTPNNDENSVAVVDLETATLRVLDSVNDQEKILFFDFINNGDELVYVSGGTDGKDNSIFRVDLNAADSEPERIKRGAYARWAAVAPDGSGIAILNYQIQPEGIRGPDFLNLEYVSLEDGEQKTLFTGAEIVDDEATNIQFAAPLRWVE